MKFINTYRHINYKQPLLDPRYHDEHNRWHELCEITGTMIKKSSRVFWYDSAAPEGCSHLYLYRWEVQIMVSLPIIYIC